MLSGSFAVLVMEIANDNAEALVNALKVIKENYKVYSLVQLIVNSKL